MEKQRIVFLDWLRVAACFMVMLVHSCEPFYLSATGETHIATAGHALWITIIDSACRACVPLFVMTSAYLLFPIKGATGAFFKRRLVRVLPPFLLWSAVYIVHWEGSWTAFLFNFPMTTGGHLWFVPMLLGIYLTMPLLSPWAERVTKRALLGYLVLWGVTTLFPYWRKIELALCGEPSFGAIPYLYGECPWNGFGTFHYVSGFIGYVLLGFYCRKFTAEKSLGQTLRRAVPLWLAGYAVAAILFYVRIPSGGVFPMTRPYAAAVDMEMSWEFCSAGIACMVLGYFWVFQRITAQGWFYARVIRPLSEASYGTYLMHMLILAPVHGYFITRCATPVTICATALVTFTVASLVSITLRKIPKIGFLFG